MSFVYSDLGTFGVGSFLSFPASSAGTRRRFWMVEGHLGELAPIPGDAISNVSVTFDGAIAGSEIRAYLQSDGTELFGIESCDADHVFSGVPYYGTGQDVTIRIVNVGYRIKEFTYTVLPVDQVIPIQMEEDKWYSNPA